MVWKPGQSGNRNGRPRAAYHWDGEKIVEDTDKERPESDYYKAILKTDVKRSDYRYLVEDLQLKDPDSAEKHLQDPILFQHKLLANESLPIGLRVAIAQNIAPYCHPRVGLVTMPRFVETPIEVPDFESIEQAEQFLLSLSKRLGSGELSVESINGVATLIREWIHSRRQGQELELKRLASDNTGAEQIIRIEGGLPPLPMGPGQAGIIMPILPGAEKPAIDAEPLLGIDRDTTPRDPAIPLPDATDPATLHPESAK